MNNELPDLMKQQDFFDILKLDKVIIYILVDWSGQERVSRHVIHQALNELDKLTIPVFKIDCSDQENKYVEHWLIEQRENRTDFYYGGLGETLLVTKGEIIDFIKYPAQLGLDQTKKKIYEWNNTSFNTERLMGRDIFQFSFYLTK